MLNSVNLVGRLTKEVELRTNDSGSNYAFFSLAVQRNYKNKNGEYDSDFFDCNANGATAELLSKYFKKGDFCPVSGELRTRKWVSDDGQNRTATFVSVNNITFISSKRDNVQNVGQASSADDAFTSEGFEQMTVPAEGDLPF